MNPDRVSGRGSSPHPLECKILIQIDDSAASAEMIPPGDVE
jgi:hypothetical protein